MDQELNKFTLEERRKLIEEMVEEDAQQLWIWSLKRCGYNEDAASDFYDDTLLAFLEQRYPWKKAIPFRPYLYWLTRRIKSAQMKKAATTREKVGLPGHMSARTDGYDPFKSLALKETDNVYEAVRDRLPADSYARTLWDLMYVDEVYSIKEQIETLKWPEDRVRTARKLIKERCREVFKKFGVEIDKLKKGKK